MKILFLDVNSNGVRVPFAQKRIPLPLVVTALISIFGPPKILASEVDCVMPKGDFRNSCTDIVIKSYLSTDPNVPATCMLTASCPTMFTGLAPVDNKVFIAADVQLEQVTNQNGTLAHGGKALSGGVAGVQKNLPNDPYHCLPPEGSYHKTCETNKRPYISTDPQLANTDLCEAEATCETLSGYRESSMIYFNIKAKQTLWQSTQRIENCDGSLISGSDDNRCQIKDKDKIRKIADENGRTASIKL